MELANFVLDSGQTVLQGDIRLSAEIAGELVKEIYVAWHGSQIGGKSSPTTQRLTAHLRRIEQGASGVEVLEASFLRRDNVPAATFIARVHPRTSTQSAISQELALADALSRSGRDEICCRILPGHFAAGRAVVYYHAGQEFRRLDDLIVTLCQSADDSVFALFVDSLAHFLRTATDTYDAFARASLVLPTTQYIDNIASDLPPDLVLDLRHIPPSFSPGMISLLQEPGRRSKQVSADTLVNAVANPKQRPASVRVTFSKHQIPQSRYMTLPLTVLSSDGVEVWLLISDTFAQNPALSGDTVQLELQLPCAQLRAATDLLTERGFADAALRSRAQYLELLNTSAPHELRATLRHRDFHTGNVLGTPTQLKLVDLGDVNEDLLGVDVSRLEVSLMRRLIDRLGLTLADVHTVISSLNDPASQRLDRRLERVCQLLATLRAASEYVRAKHGITEPELQLSRLLQTLYYQRYLLSEVLASSATASRRDSFAAYAGAILHEFEEASRRVTGADDRLLLAQGTSAAAEGDNFGMLWTRALALESGSLLPDAEAVLKAIQRRVGPAWDNPLTDLQSELLYTSDEHPFQSPKHVLLYGPTSCGKTTVADAFLLRTALVNKRRRLGLYIAPTRALAQEKYHELRAKLANTLLWDGLVLSTGENLEHDHRILTARFTIATMVYEKANILFSRNRRALDQLGCVVVDEVHMIEDLERGPMLELALTKIQDNRRRMDRSTDRQGEHLRVIAISTEGADPGSLASFLSVIDPDTLSVVPPLVFRGHRRPVPVAHKLVVPSSAKQFEAVPITTISQDDDRILTDDRFLAIARDLQPSQAILSGARHAAGKTDLQTRLFSLLDSRITQLRNRGYRAIVFVPSKTELESLADAFRIRRHATQDVLASEILDRLRSAAKSAGEMDTGHRVCLAAAKGVFIHHSEVEPAARREMEELLCEALYPGSTQVVFATETLSYGVNLAVNDVILFGSRFYKSGRRRVLSQCPLSVCEFHNMMGRAGRLGRGNNIDTSAFVVVTLETNPLTEVVKSYYSDVPMLSSALLDREDKAVLLANLERSEFGLSPDTSFGQRFTYPFVRSVLDALRHLSVINSPSRALYVKVPLTDLYDFLFHTLYAEERLKRGAEVAMGRERELFRTAVDGTLNDLATFPLNLVDRDSVDGRDYYAITSRGEAIIDTGTEITTLKPLLDITRKLQQKWAATVDHKRFPSALYLLAVTSQLEAYRHVIRCAPEVSDADMSRLPADDARSNRQHVFECFVTALATMGVDLPDPVLPGDLRQVLDEHFAPPRDNGFFGKYEGGLTDAVLRLFCAVSAWSRGAARSDVRELILSAVGDPIWSTQLSGFGGFRDQASWKLIFLARILSGPDPYGAATLATKDEKALYALSFSVRIGCEPQACRLMFQDYPESLSREEATTLVAAGYSGDRLVREPALSAPPSIPADRFAALRSRLCDECGERYTSLSRTWSAALGNEPSEAELASLWDTSEKAFLAAIDCYYGSRSGLAQAERSLAVQLSWPPIIEGERRQVRDAGLADRTVLRFAAGADDATIRWVLDSTVAESHAPERTLAVRAIQVLSDWSVMSEHGGTTIAEVLPGPDEEPILVCVVFPWIPASEAMPYALKDSLAIRTGRGQRIVLTSPAAFMLLLSGAVRAFLSVKELFEFFATGIAVRDDRLCVVGFDQAEEVLLDKVSAGSMPIPLRESLLNHYELGFR
jgi:superfamily II DNA/RNA helicase